MNQSQKLIIRQQIIELENRINFLCGRYPQAVQRNSLAFLDLNLPRMTGREFLSLIRSSVQFRLTPVVVLSTSRQPEDVRQAYAGGANTYIEKPLDFGRFVAILKTLQQMWLEMAVLPPAPPA